MTPSYDFLLEEVQILRKRLADLFEASEAAKLQTALGLTVKESEVVAALLNAPGALKKGVMYDLVFQHDNGDGPYIKIVDVVVCKVRKKAREGCWPGSIVTVWGTGYRLDEPMREFLQGIINPAPQEIAA